MAEPAVFLIHGLGGTQYDLGSMHKRLKNAGFVTYSITLPGHGGQPSDLLGVRAEDWLEAVRVKYREIIGQHEVLHVMGMCMGSLLAIETCKREQHSKGRLVALAPPVFIDGWSTPWYRDLRHLLYHVPGVADRMRVDEEEPYGIKNEQLRGIVRAKFERGDAFAYSWVPLACIREVDRLRRYVKKGLARIPCPTLIIHAREDELTSLRSANFLVEHIGGGKRAGQARMVILENSYHLICVDNDKELLAQRTLEFFGVGDPGQGARGDDPGMTPAQIDALLAEARGDLERGDFGALYRRGIPDFAWYQPGHHRGSGIFRGAKGLARLQAWAGGLAFTALGTPVHNAGMTVMPATLCSGSLVSHGVLEFTLRQGRLLEARWFPDEAALEDAHFGGEPVADGPSAAEKALEAAAALSKTLSKSPGEETLLRLYALYKQGSVGDVSGERPGLLDVVGRAKFDAWASRKGLAQEQAIKEYAALVQQLKAAEAQTAEA
ncbi:acyl-CoA-binding protein [Duganella sp. HH105]|uniref:acyl-CoA-binding protein n=1 Tax=Duganella sp. HH105 TaxID=1781067 RepID=UPI000877D43F|nr:acyl-CoA-binding protein [Duganella sp. HH105]OEZ61304.1 thermostable monoacylglycerol lipase [Duganella sp. HH105]